MILNTGCTLAGRAVARGRGNQLLGRSRRHRRHRHRHQGPVGKGCSDLFQLKDYLVWHRGSSIDLSVWSSLWEECQWWDTVKGSLVWTTPSSSQCENLINQINVLQLNHQ